MAGEYTEKNIRSLSWKEHIRLRPGMYIGKLGDGRSSDDGIYVLLKEIIDNSIDEYVMGFGNKIEITLEDGKVIVRDYGRGIPLGKVIDCVSKINTGGKYDSEAFQKSVGLNGVGTKAVNALSSYFKVVSFRDNKEKLAEYSRGEIEKNAPISKSSQKNGTEFTFIPDTEIFPNYRFFAEHIENQIWNYVYLNAGLTVLFNGQKYFSKHGLRDLLQKHLGENEIYYPIIHLQDKDIEISLTHGNQYGEDYYSFVNGQYTTQGGTHLAAFREAIVKTVKDFYKKDFDSCDVRQAITAAVSVRVQEPIFESQTKTKLGSTHIAPEGKTVRSFINDFIRKELDNYLHRNPDTASALLQRITRSERERKEMAGIRKLAQQRTKKANIHNKKLRDCRIHLMNKKNPRRLESTIFITEGDSASGSLTQVRDVATQAVFSLRGKPTNCFGAKRKIIYENEELSLIQHALNIEDGVENLKYNQVVIATDADVDGMHIRLLLMTFFLQFFPDLVRKGHLYILETPLFRVRSKKSTHYCYSEEEKQRALRKLGKNAEIVRFKGLGEISPNEFRMFIGQEMRLEPVILSSEVSLFHTLKYFMGKNTPERQNFIVNNLHLEKDPVLTAAKN